MNRPTEKRPAPARVREHVALRIGVMGGSFDPPHVGHFLLAQDAAESLHLDRVLFVPAAQAPLKPNAPVAPATARLAMLRAAVKARNLRTPDAALWEVSDWELRQDGESFSINTVLHLREIFPDSEIFWMIGGDRLADLHRWHRATELFALAQFVVAPRRVQASTGNVEPPQPAPAGARVHYLAERRIDISSTEIRARIRANLPVDLFLPLPALKIIQRRKLYQP